MADVPGPSKTAWGRAWGKTEKAEEPIVSLVEIMSEELAEQLDGEEKKIVETPRHDESYMPQGAEYMDDFELAQALQREFDREYDLSIRLEENLSKGINSVQMTPDRYATRHSHRESDSESSDDDEMREFATHLLYAKLDEVTSPVSLQRGANGEIVTKHDSVISGMRNADKTLNDAFQSTETGDMSGESMSNRVYNKLRIFNKTEQKRQARLRDKEEKATAEQSVDAVTRLILFKFINSELFDEVGGVVAVGKESVVLHANSAPDNHFAVKVFKTTLSEFKNRIDYVRDDRRFKNPRRVLKVWAEKEFMNLVRMHRAGLRCPEPIKLKKHVMIMSLIGTAGVAAPKLKHVEWYSDESKTKAFEQVKEIVIRMFKECNLVHGDLSEFNLLLHDDNVFVIDVGQAMDLSHPRVLVYLVRDLRNVLSFFSRIGTPDLPSDVDLFNVVTDLVMTADVDLLVQVESFEKDNRNMQLRADKVKPADGELRRFYEECKDGDNPAKEYI